jgi:exonuclease III
VRLLEEFKQAGLMCAALQETRVRLRDDDSHPLICGDKYNVLCSGVAKKWNGPRHFGLGIALDKKYQILWSDCPTDRLICICTKIGDLLFTIISAYAPTNFDVDNLAATRFYIKLRELLATVPGIYLQNVLVRGHCNIL